MERATFTWLLSEDILSEYKAVLQRMSVRRETIGSLINLLREDAETLSPRLRRGYSPDPGDDVFCACAEEGNADFIVTLNPRDFPQSALTAKVLAPGTPLPKGGQAMRKGMKRGK